MQFSTAGENGRKTSLICKNMYNPYDFVFFYIKRTPLQYMYLGNPVQFWINTHDNELLSIIIYVYNSIVSLHTNMFLSTSILENWIFTDFFSPYSLFFLLYVTGEYLQTQCLQNAVNCTPCPERLPSCIGLPDGNNPFPTRPSSQYYVKCFQNRTVAVEVCQVSLFDPVTRECSNVIDASKDSLIFWKYI